MAEPYLGQLIDLLDELKLDGAGRLDLECMHFFGGAALYTAKVPGGAITAVTLDSVDQLEGVEAHQAQPATGLSDEPLALSARHRPSHLRVAAPRKKGYCSSRSAVTPHQTATCSKTAL